VSLQTKRADTRLAWRAKVKAVSSASLPEGNFSATSPIAVTLFYFPETEMQGDIDNHRQAGTRRAEPARLRR
jgi:hypothetical protein